MFSGTSVACRMLLTMLKCESMTPLGTPVVPEEKGNTHTSRQASMDTLAGALVSEVSSSLTLGLLPTASV